MIDHHSLKGIRPAFGSTAARRPALSELLILECFQAGLSRECVLNKREAFWRIQEEYCDLV